ncbi:LysR substrate-binding domain-containing protein [Spongiactinospora sp. TRM90649]|uniref:LysR family transcriptional regulator n=1 Tax=Spongiactinospora sp. TRM90649 TaxID=3031114 RepID=UPI0023F8F643|nr:LysR substrate-binding domain-containing protein [Spongiactinospora sp. TRM90649]MDF5756378.1 LysR substrate-binding domain-containing protein [Spongiactinospora sp. TRM90649]
MDLRQLEYVIAVAEELHFGRAAVRMHVAQQSVSEQIRRLEREIGAPLFIRTSRRVTLTAVGEAFLPEARRTVAAARHALDTGRRAATGPAGELRLGYAEDLGPRLFQLAVPELRSRFPDIRPLPCPMTTADQVTALCDGRLDIGFCWNAETGPDLDSLLVTRESLVVALAAGHPLAAETAIDPARLSELPLIVVERDINPWLHDHVVGQLRTRGATVRIHREISSLDRLLPLVLADAAIGITIGGAALARILAGIVYRPFTEPSPHADHRILWRRDTADPAVLAFVEIVRQLRDAGAFRPGLPGLLGFPGLHGEPPKSPAHHRRTFGR